MNDILYIVVPAYNEAENIRSFIEDWYPVIEKHPGGGSSRLVVINDGSTDSTWDILREMSAERPLLEPLTKPNGGHGPTLIYGYRHAVQSGAEYVFQTDSDGQTDPSEFEGFWRARRKYDAVFGMRPERGDGRDRLLVEKVLCAMLRVIFGVRVPDANAPFRIMKAKKLEKYLDRLPRDYSLPNVMLTTYFVYYHEKAAFRKITFRPRKAGKNSMNMKKIVKTGLQAMQEFLILRKGM